MTEKDHLDELLNNARERELLPCPFCGGEARIEYYANTEVCCDACSVGMAGSFSTPDLAIAAWNKRAPDRKSFDAGYDWAMTLHTPPKP